LAVIGGSKYCPLQTGNCKLKKGPVRSKLPPGFFVFRAIFAGTD
jgi:hypothetical protein